MRETVAVHLGLHALPIFQWGTEEQKRTFLPPLASGEHIACFGLTEPGAGSDVAAMRSTARKDGDDYILNGEKMWITLSNVADRFLVFAKTNPEKGAGRGQDGRARLQHRLDQHAGCTRPQVTPAGVGGRGL